MEFIGIIADKDDFLAHHGTKGMKWGVWNAETRARYFGNKKTPRERGYAPSEKQVSKAGQRYSDAKKELEKAEAQYRKSPNSETAKQLAKANKNFDHESKHNDYVVSGRQAQRRGRALKAATAVGIGATGLATAGATSFLGAAGSNMAYIVGSGGSYAVAAAKLATSQMSVAKIYAGRAAVSAAVSVATGTGASKQKRTRKDD